MKKIMRLTKLVALFVGIMLVLSGCGGEQKSAGDNNEPSLVENGKFTYAMSGLYEPFNYKDGGKLVGFDVEIGAEIAKRMDMEADPITTPWETIIQGLEAKKYDAIVGSMAITEKRQEEVDFTLPYYRSGAQIFISNANETIKSPDDIKDKVIGVLRSSTYRDDALGYTDEDKIIGYDSDVVALRDLTTGRVEAVITDQIVGYMAIKEKGLAIKGVGKPLRVDEEMAIAVNKDNPVLLNKINAALEDMIQDGTYDKISNKWFGRNILGSIEE